jgi:hypothetical protein
MEALGKEFEKACQLRKYMMTDKDMERCTMSLFIREIQIKSIL